MPAAPAAVSKHDQAFRAIWEENIGPEISGPRRHNDGNLFHSEAMLMLHGRQRRIWSADLDPNPFHSILLDHRMCQIAQSHASAIFIGFCAYWRNDGPLIVNAVPMGS